MIMEVLKHHFKGESGNGHHSAERGKGTAGSKMDFFREDGESGNGIALSDKGCGLEV